MSNFKIPLALRDGKIVCISDIGYNERGLRCGCICPLCKTHLIARMGEVYRHHFSHTGNACDKDKAYQLSIYMLIKELIDKRQEIMLPDLYLKYKDTCFELTRENIHKHTKLTKEEKEVVGYEHIERVVKQTKIAIDKIDVSFTENKLISALEVYSNNKCFAIKVVFPDAICKIYNPSRHKDMSTLEIDCKDSNFAFTDRKSIEKLIIDDVCKKAWIYNTKVETVYERVIANNKLYIQKFETERKRMLEESKVYNQHTYGKALYNPINQKSDTPIEANKYKQGYAEVFSNFNPESEDQIRDSFDQRWLYCTECKNIKTAAEMQQYGGKGSINKGICSECDKKTRAENNICL